MEKILWIILRIIFQITFPNNIKEQSNIIIENKIEKENILQKEESVAINQDVNKQELSSVVENHPKVTKYCEYSGNRKVIKNICDYGSPWANQFMGYKEDSFSVKSYVKLVETKAIDNMVFSNEPERFHLIQSWYLRERLENVTHANCFMNGSCVGFKIDDRWVNEVSIKIAWIQGKKVYRSNELQLPDDNFMKKYKNLFASEQGKSDWEVFKKYENIFRR